MATVRVCQEWVPKGTYKGQRADGFPMDETLKSNIDALLLNIVDDWDFLFIVSGGGMVRQGKSMIAQQIGFYWTYQLSKVQGIKVPFTIKDNIVFHGERLIKQGNILGVKYPYSVLIFDEAGADLEGIKVMRRTTQVVRDYLRECGQYNMLTILVLPEFFDLPKGIALSRSDFLIDCYALANQHNKFVRGYFNFYSRPNKKKLYLKGKKELDYKSFNPDFSGRWGKFWPLNEEEYRTAKRAALKSRVVISSREHRMSEYLRGAFKILVSQGKSYREIARDIQNMTSINTSHQYIGRILGVELPEEDDSN